MAEAGIEGLFPLARDPQGRLAVRAVGGRGGPSQQITIGPINIYSKRDRNEEDAREILAVVAQGMRSKSTFREAME
jgi:hypothetical protein